MIDNKGRTLAAEVQSKSVDCDGTPCLLVCVDATLASAPMAVEHAELKLLSTRVPVVLWSVSTDFRFLTVSGSALGKSETAVKLVGMSLYDYFETRDEDFPSIRAHRQALNGESVSYDYEHDGNTFQCWLEPLISPAGVQGVIGVAIDVTEQRRIEAQLRASEERNRAIIENATDVIYTHDLRGNFT